MGNFLCQWKYNVSKSGCEHSINHYKNSCKSAGFSIRILKKLDGESFINGQQNFAVQKLCLQREDYWTPKLRIIYGLKERAKNTNWEQPTGKLFLPSSKFRNRCENLENRHINEETKCDTNETLLSHIATFPPKRRNERKGSKKVSIICKWWVKNIWLF